MSQPDALEHLMLCLERDLGARIDRGFLAAVRSLAVSLDEVLDDPNVMADVSRVAQGRGRKRGDPIGNRSARATRSLGLEAKYQELLRDVRRFPTSGYAADGSERASRSRPKTPPYADLMAQALEEAEADEFGERLPPPPPILGGYRDGTIWVEADPWVPLALVTAYYRALQRLLGAKGRQVVHVASLELYIWVKRRRRGPKAKETWRETTAAWNRSRPNRVYPSETNLHKDFHRIQRSIEEARPVFEELRIAALKIEAREAARG